MHLVRVSHPPVSSLGSMAELYVERCNEQDRLSVGRELVGRRGDVHPEVLVQLRNNQTQMPRVLMYTEGNTEASVFKGKDVKVCRSHQAVACKNRYTEELGKPQRFLVWIQR